MDRKKPATGRLNSVTHGARLSAFLEAPSLGSLYSVLIAPGGSRFFGGISYGPHPRHSFDVYAPRADEPRKAVVFFVYGGGWDSGNRQMYGFVGASLAARGYVTVIPDYRLYPEVGYPAFMSDLSAAYHGAINGGAVETVDDRPVILMGHSAGAHMAALICYDERHLTMDEAPVARPRGFVGLSGPYGFDAKSHERTRPIFASAQTEAEVNPVAQVKPGAPPALLIHGAKDRTVLTLNAIRLQEALAAAGSSANVVELDEAGHLGPLLALSRPFDRKFGVLPRIDRFLADLA